MVQQLSGQVVLDSIQEDEKTTAVVATFSDANTSDPASSFAATVNWGDGTTEAGTVTGTNGSFAVAVADSTHVYTDEGTDPITVTITGTAGGNIAPTNLRYFLAIDGLNGGSTDATHVGWFDVSSYDIGALVAAATGAKTFSPLTVTLPSTGLTGLLADIAQSSGITSVRLEGVSTSGQSVYDLTLGNVSVSNYADASGGAKISFDYQQVSLTTTAINPDGSLGSSQNFAWDRTRNQPGGVIPAPTPNPAGADNIVPRNLHYFLAIDGLDGGSKDAAHVGWFDVSSYDVGALVAAIGGRASFSPLSVTFASTGLTDVLADLANGNPIGSMRLEGVTNTGQAVYDLTLGDVSVNNYADATTGAQLSFSYQQVALTTTSSNSDGSTGNPQTFSWDLTRGQPGVSITAPTPGTAAGNTAPSSNLDYFLAIDGIDGESNDRMHENWFAISNYDFSALMPATGSPTFSPLTVTLHASGLTGLLTHLANTNTIRSVRLEGVTRGGNDQAVYDLTLGNVRVSDYEDTSGGDTLSFTYQLVNLTTTAINPDGSRGGSQTFSWNLATNSPGGSISTPVPGTTPGELAGPDAQYFLAIDGLNGGVTDVLHRGWFDVSGYDFGAQLTALSMGGTKPTFSPLTVTLSATGSTGVFADLLEGATLPPPGAPNHSFPITSLRLQGVTNNDQAIYDLTLGNVTVTNYQDASGGDQLTFSYQQIELTTVPRNIDGSLGTPLNFNWDVTKNQAILPGSIPVPTPVTSPGAAGNLAPANLRYFLAIKGLDGGSTDAAHPGWFDVSSYDFAAQLAATGSLPRFSPLTVTLPSTGLTDVLADLPPGTDITSLRLEGVNTAGQAVYDLSLGNATVTNYTDVPGGDQLSFNYQQVSLTTRAVNSNGSLGPSQTSAWDVAHNVALAGSIPTPTPGTAPGNVAPANLHYFLAVDGLNGGATDATHAGWFDVATYEFDVQHPAPAGRAIFSPLSVTLPSTGVTRVLADLAQLSAIKSVRLEGVTDTGQAVYDLTLGNVEISNYNDASSGAQLSFSYQQVALTTTAINPNGSLGSSQSFAWDVTHNVPGGPIPAPIPNTATGQIALNGTVAVTEGDVLTPAGLTFSAIPGHAFSGNVATFTDTNINNVASDFTATINWGDGTTTTGVVTDEAGAIGVSGTHAYAMAGTDAVQVTLAEDAPGTAAATAMSTAQVGQPLSGQIVPASISEGTATTGVVATFSDADTTDRASNFTAAVNWGDGTTEVGTVAGANGSFTISVPGSTHVYADEGTVQPVVTIVRSTDNDQIALTGTVTVAEGDVLTPTATTISVQQGQAFNGIVATFTDTNINNVASDFVATIDWGDGTTTTGAVTDDAGQIGVSGTHTYTMSGTDTVSVTLTEDAPGTATAVATSVADITPCYCDGTLILTDRGEVPVQTLSIGDHVITADGVARPIRWLGRRSYAGRFARGSHVLPVCFKAGALDVNSPRRDLWVSPHHAMFLNGVLIEALDLINGASIFQAECVEQVEYFHIELDSHDILVAEGALSESFVDDDSRGMFQNAHEFAALYPDRPREPARYCARRVAFGAELEAVRRQIAHRAGIPYRRPAAESRPCALVIDSRLPEVGHDGGANAVLDHARALQAAGFEVSFLALADQGRDAGPLSSLGVTLLSLPPNGSFVDVARAHAGEFDLIYLHRVESASHCLKPARRYFDAHIVYSVADLHHLRLQSQSRFDRAHASELMHQAGVVAVQELAAALSADCVITHSQTEADKLGQLPSIAAERKVHVAPWTVPPAAVQTPFIDRSGVAFIGCFAHAPNVDAVRWLVEDIMPLVWVAQPDLPCLIVGSDMSADLYQQLARPGVKILGRVERLSEVFEQARLTIAPLRFGAGLKDKVLRSMAAGLPCVGTSEAFNGMQGLPGAISDACQHDTAPGLAAAIVRMHGDEAPNTSCGQIGLDYVGAFYNEARVNALIRDLAQPALDCFRAKAKSKTAGSEVLHFAPAPRAAEATGVTQARGRERRIVFG
jgi:type VI protein secretion system component Hcp